MKIGAAATRMPASDDAMWRSPYVISKNGTTTCTIAMNAIAPQRPRSAPSASSRIAIGTSTAAPSAIRAKTMKIGSRPSSSATLMKR